MLVGPMLSFPRATYHSLESFMRALSPVVMKIGFVAQKYSRLATRVLAPWMCQ